MFIDFKLSFMQSYTVQPIQQNQRTTIVDILRGWALLGVVLMNYADAYYLGADFGSQKMGMATKILMGFSQIVFAAKSWTMLSFLFGYGFAVLMQNISNKGINPYFFFSRRMFWLFILAMINSAFFFGDILKDYAVMGMVLLLFYRCSTKVSFYISVGLLLSIPAVTAFVQNLNKPGGMQLIAPYLNLFQSHNPVKVLWFGLLGTYKYEIENPGYLITVHVVMLTCFMLGLAAQKVDFFNRLADNKKYVRRIFWGSLVFTLFMIGYFIIVQNMKWAFAKYYSPFYWVILSSMVFITSALCWLYVSNKLKKFFRAMQTIGKMTLTNYITQNVLAVLLFSGFGFGLSIAHRLHFGYYLLFAFTIYVLQVYFSKWWLSKYYYGPIEWIWRQLSYGKRFPIKKVVITEDFMLTESLPVKS